MTTDWVRLIQTQTEALILGNFSYSCSKISGVYRIFLRGAVTPKVGVLTYYYRPRRSWGKVMFLHVSVIVFTGGVCISACWDTPPPQEDTRKTPPKTYPPGRPHQEDTRKTPQEDTPPGSNACWEIRATRGR